MKSLKERTFHWQAQNAQGQILSGEIMALSMNLAMASLQKKGLKRISLHKKKSAWLLKKITPMDMIIFFRQLATLVFAGISLSEAIRMLSQQSGHIRLLKMISSIREDITAGNSLTTAIQKFPKLFDDMICHLILAGEKSGTLDIMLLRVAEHRERIFLLKNKIKQALFYPVTLFSVAILVTIVMLVFVVPRFTDLFRNMHARLPALTLHVVQLANFLTNHWLVLMVTGTVIISPLYLARRHPSVKKMTDTVLLELPLAGTAMQKFILAHFARSLAILYAAGIPVTEALKMLTHSTGNLLYKTAIHELYLGISAGRPLHVVMQQCKLFPMMMGQMIRAGEESGTLDTLLGKIADFYEADLDHLIGQSSRLLEPLIMVILGVVIGGLVIAMYLPVFKLGALI